MPQDSEGAEDDDSCEYNQCGMVCYMYKDRVCNEDVDSYE